MNSYRLSLFGTVSVERDGVPIAIAGTRQRALLALMAINANLTLTPDTIVDSLWGDNPPAKPGGALRFHIHKLRNQLDPDTTGRNELLVTQPGGYMLAIDPEDIDTTRYERLISDATNALSVAPESAVSLVEEAETLAAAGSPLNEFLYDEFARSFTERMGQALHKGVTVGIDVAIARGNDERAIGLLRGALDDDPYDEGLYRRLMLVQYRSGRPTSALETFKSARLRLGEDLGLEPSPELADLEEQILLHQVEPPTGPSPQRGLPAEVTALIGRSAEVGQATQLLSTHRLVSLTGFRGSGKSRIALRLAHESPAAMWFTVPETDDERTIDIALQSAMQRAFPHLPPGGSDPLTVLAPVEALVVIDAADTSPLGSFAAQRILEAGANLRVLATTRTPLGVDGEAAISIGGLGPRESRQLLEEQSGAASSLTDDAISQQTGGLPAAIEALAVRTRIGATAAPSDPILVLDDVLAALADELSDNLSAIAALQPPFGPTDAMAALGDPLDVSLDGLAALIDAGVIIPSSTGMAMQPLLRAELLNTTDRLNVPGVLRFAADQAGSVPLAPSVIDAALVAGREAGLASAADAAVAALVPVWWRNGPRVGRSRLLPEEIGATFDADDPRVAELLFIGAHLCLLDNDIPAAIDLVHRHARTTVDGSPKGRARHDQLLGHIALYQGDMSTAVESLTAAVQTALQADIPNAPTLLASLGFTALASADADSSGYAERVIATAAHRTDPTARPLAAELAGHASYYAGDLDAAALQLSSAISGYAEGGLVAWGDAPRALLGMIACLRDDPETANRVLDGANADTGHTPATEAVRALAAAQVGDTNAMNEALRHGARSLADGTNPVWTFRLLMAAARSADEHSTTFERALMEGAAAALAHDVGLRIPVLDQSILEGADPEIATPAAALEVLRRL